MKKSISFLTVIVFATILLSLLLNGSIYRRQIAFQRSILKGQATSAADKLEQTLLKFENDVNALLYSNSLMNLDYSSEDSNQEGLTEVERLFLNYQDLIKNIVIEDSNQHVLNLSYNKKNILLIDPYLTQKQTELISNSLMQKADNEYLYTFPVFNKKQLAANLVFTFDFPRYFARVLNEYYHDAHFFQWVIEEDGNLLFSNSQTKLQYTRLPVIQKDILTETNDFLKHNVSIDNKNVKLYSALIPFHTFGNRMGVLFSMQQRFIFSLLFTRILVLSLLNAVVLIFLLLILYRAGGKDFVKLGHKVGKLAHLQSIFDKLPVGIMVLDTEQNTRLVNQTARDMLLIKTNEPIAGKNLTDRFMLSRDYYDPGSETAFDSNQFVLYRHEGEEVAVYKKDLPFNIDNKEYIVSVFSDITPIEKARKYEAAANTAKSEFLAKMSHEIRTPMNGIIGMTEAMDQENLNEEQKEYLQIVKRSADLLLNLIDDILDFSKIEAGKMQLEEIPFKLREEVRLSVDLFKPIIEEKNISLQIKVNPDVPENIIGDPFRLRQVLSNLISNSVKFTHEGQIVVGIQLEEEYNSNLTLLFYVEDTGVGIPHNRIESIFNSFTQAEESTSRKYGGSGLGTTISKQLVNLMHGEIWAESPSSISTSPNYPGSKFSFTIEVYSNERLIKALHTEEVQQLSQLKVLIITHILQNKQRLLRFFEQEGMKTEIFEYSVEKESDLKKKLTDPVHYYHALFIMDEPGMDGLQLTKKLKEDKLTELHLVFLLSSNHRVENYLQSRRNGVDFYILEPFEQEDILSCLHDSFPAMEKSTREPVRKVRTDLSVLVAEDNEINIRVAQTIFGHLGYKIDIARNGVEAIEKIKEGKYDIVFMDLIMPERDGIQTTVELRGMGYQMPVVAMTATASSKSKQKAISAGMNDYIVKPVKADTIRNILLKWFA
jgi:signal transduction histidine kinase/CheY-like chemotaxis protein